MRILILDDQQAIVTMLSRVCSLEGHVVAAFTSSAEALIHLATTPVELLITDMQMPEPDGVAVVGEARRLQPDIFTLIITGHAAQYPLAELLAAGTADVIFKPFHMNELRARLLLTQQRMHLISCMRRQHDDLQEVSRTMIDGLEEELGQMRGNAPLR
ncbi:MAG TPA: response regulator [Vicinamibacterales bacterium]